MKNCIACNTCNFIKCPWQINLNYFYHYFLIEKTYSLSYKIPRFNSLPFYLSLNLIWLTKMIICHRPRTVYFPLSLVRSRFLFLSWYSFAMVFFSCCNISASEYEPLSSEEVPNRTVKTPNQYKNNYQRTPTKTNRRSIIKKQEDIQLNLPIGWIYNGTNYFNCITLDKTTEKPEIKNEPYSTIRDDLNYEKLKEKFNSIIQRDIEDIFTVIEEAKTTEKFIELREIKENSDTMRLKYLEDEFWVLWAVIKICCIFGVRLLTKNNENPIEFYDSLSESSFSFDEMQEYANEKKLFGQVLDLFDNNKDIIIRATTNITKMASLCLLVIPGVNFAWKTLGRVIDYYKFAHDCLDNIPQEKCVVIFPGLTESGDSKILKKSLVVALNIPKKF